MRRNYKIEKRGRRLYGFDYSSPYFYMVTLKRLAGGPAFSEVVDDPGKHWLRANALTWRLSEAIRTFHETWRCVEAITSYTIMPDHIHLLMKIRAVEKRLTLPRLVWLLTRRLEMAAGEGGGRGEGERAAERPDAEPIGGGNMGSAEGRSVAPLFSREWHDWIVLKAGQLEAFKRYIFENPRRRCLRQAHPEVFRRTTGVEFLGMRWNAYGNTGLLELPVVEPFRCSRSWVPGGGEWRAAVARAERIGPGCAGIGTFLSPCERECGHAIGVAGGKWIVLSPEGFGERWHPGERLERACAAGRMLFLSPYPAVAGKVDKAVLYARCHEMGDWVCRGLEDGRRSARAQD